uniref:Uncharacterized protein n=1 Tax=Aegilops tauschii subsp. strangulata TaxID=200361 RepID=A0A453T662_AEGTS
MNLPAIYRSGFKCSKCNKSFTSKEVFLDLTVTSGMKEYSELKAARRAVQEPARLLSLGGGVRTSIGVASLAAMKRYISWLPHSSIPFL